MGISPTKSDIGRKVVYRHYKGAAPEEGVITSFNHNYVFVRYGADAHSKATDPADLEWASE